MVKYIKKTIVRRTKRARRVKGQSLRRIKARKPRRSTGYFGIQY